MNIHLSTSATRKVALVTGASGGIGHTSAKVLVQAGYTVFGTSRKAGSPGHGDVSMIQCDVTSDTSVADAVAAVVAQEGRLDLLVNNAGVGLMGAAEESSIEQVHRLFDANVYGTIRTTNAVLPTMRRQRSGRIVNVSSILGIIPAPFSAHYSAAKHAVEGYSGSLDHEVREFGIRVVLVEPGMTQSAFEQNADRADSLIDDYDTGRASVLGWYSEGMKVADTTDSVAKAILIAAETENPKPRYQTGKGMARTAILRRLVPASAFDKSLRKQMGLS